MKLKLKNKSLALTPEKALRSLLAADGNAIYASANSLYKDAVFGRDALEVAEDLLVTHPGLVFNIIKNLAALQGTATNATSEEEPGRIHHEYRSLIVDGHRINPQSEATLKELSQKWGGSNQAVLYYGSVDATPLYIRLIGRYVELYGNGILTAYVFNKDGNYITVYASLKAATKWLVKRLESSSSGLLEFCSTNPSGIANQAWKDSAEFYLHSNGRSVNHKRPVASIEVQGLAYDALQVAAQVFPQYHQRFTLLAKRLQSVVLRKLWLPYERYFALGLDYTSRGLPRRIETITANPASLLDTAIFDDLPALERQKYITGIINRIFSIEFLTDAGVRSRSLRHQYLLPFWDYHGSFTTWPKETYDIAKGLRRQGCFNLAKELENRLLNVCSVAGEYPEFIYVDAECRVIYGRPATAKSTKALIITATNTAEPIQAWTVSAVVAILYQKSHASQLTQWQWQLEQAVTSRIPEMPGLVTHQLKAYYPPYRFKIAAAS